MRWAWDVGGTGILEEIWRHDGTPQPVALNRLFG
jgi:hypothetical protein